VESKIALITGITGQDGSYLAEQLIEKGYEVHGIIRRTSTFNTARLVHLYRSTEDDQKIHLHYIEGTDSLHLFGLIEKIRPTEIYNLMAQSHVALSFDQPENAMKTAGLNLLTILEVVKSIGLKTKIYQASTSEMFGDTLPPQNEHSTFSPRSPYAAAKLYAHNISTMYREAYGLHVSTGILFNHESPRRGRTFVTRKITTAVAEIVKGKREKLILGNLHAKRDWGYAPEYTEAMWRILQLDTPVDLVIATGKQFSVADFCKFSFESVNLNWENYVQTSSRFERALEVESLRGDSTKAKDLIKWEAKTLAPELAKIMVTADMQLDSFLY
jgi:GDPmannose 4,6-dehydratase